MPNHETPSWPGTTMGVLALFVCAAASAQVAFGWPLPARYTGPALLALSIHGALVLAFLAGNLWQSAAELSNGHRSLRLAVAVAAGLAAWAGLWLGAKSGLLMLSAGHVLLALYWVVQGRRAGQSSGCLLTALFCAGNAAALAAAAFLGPFA